MDAAWDAARDAQNAWLEAQIANLVAGGELPTILEVRE
jgi:hypothetical protein